MTLQPPPTFFAVYRWRLQPGTEDEFVRAWAEVTRAIREQRGGLGSRLHRAEDGWWVVYAAWPERERWEAMQALEPCAPEASARMRAAIAESAPALLLEPVQDLLVAPGD